MSQSKVKNLHEKRVQILDLATFVTLGKSLYLLNMWLLLCRAVVMPVLPSSLHPEMSNAEGSTVPGDCGTAGDLLDRAGCCEISTNVV